MLFTRNIYHWLLRSQSGWREIPKLGYPICLTHICQTFHGFSRGREISSGFRTRCQLIFFLAPSLWPYVEVVKTSSGSGFKWKDIWCRPDEAPDYLPPPCTLQPNEWSWKVNLDCNKMCDTWARDSTFSSLVKRINTEVESSISNHASQSKWSKTPLPRVMQPCCLVERHHQLYTVLGMLSSSTSYIPYRIRPDRSLYVNRRVRRDIGLCKPG